MARYDWPASPVSTDDAPGREAHNARFLPSANVRNSDASFDVPRAPAPDVAPLAAPAVVPARRRGVRPLDAPIGDALAGATNLWLPIGPSVVTNGQASGNPTVSGRIRDLRVEPVDGLRVYAAAAGGGVWRSLDAGGSWEPLDGFVVSPNRTTFTPVGSALACGALHVRFGSVADGSADVIVVGTGEPLSSADDRTITGPHPGGHLLGVGILTWPAQTGPNRDWKVDPGSEALRGGFVRSFTESPLDNRHLFAVTSDGLYQRPVGQGWAKVATTPTGCTDVLVTRVDATHVKIWVTTFAGLKVATTVVPIPAAGPAFSNVALPDAVDPSNKVLALGRPTELWVLGRRTATGSATFHPAGLWRVDPTAASPAGVEVTGVPAGLFRSSNDQSFYDIAMAVNPDNFNQLFVGGATITIGGQWSASLYSLVVAGNAAVATSVGAGVHADLHVLRVGPQLVPPIPIRTVWVGCDGGVFSSPANGVSGTFVPRNQDLATLEPGFVANHPTNDGIVAAGMQDNGTCVRIGDSMWRFIDGGDGGGIVYDPGSTNRSFYQRTRNDWQYSSGSGTAFLRNPNAQGDAETTRSAFYSGCSALLHGGVTHLLVGSDRPWYSIDWGRNWVTIPSSTDPRASSNIDYEIDRVNWYSRDDPTFLCCGSGRGGPEVITTRLSPADSGATIRVRAHILTGANLTILHGTRGGGAGTAWTWSTRFVEQIRPADGSTESAAVASGAATAFLPATDLVTDVGVHDPARGDRGSCYVTTRGADSPVIDTVWWYDGTNKWWPCGVRSTNPRGTWTGDRLVAPALAVVVDPRQLEQVYVGTSIGVIHGVLSFVTINGQPEPRWAWSPLVNGLPESAANDLAIFDNGAAAPVGPTGPVRLLRAALHGRGIWEMDLASSTTRPRTYVRVRETDTRRRVPTDLTGTSSNGDFITRFHESPDVVVDRSPIIDAAPGPRESDLWTRGGGASLLGAVTSFHERIFRVHVLVHHRWHTAAAAGDVRVALLRIDLPVGVNDPTVPATLWQAMLAVAGGGAIPATLPGGWKRAETQLVRAVGGPIDARRPRAATFDLVLTGHPNGRVMLMAVVMSKDDPLTAVERFKTDNTPCTTVSELTLHSRHVAARSVTLTA